MDGLAAVQARIAAIESSFSSLAASPVPVVGGATVGTASVGAASFDAVLGAALRSTPSPSGLFGPAAPGANTPAERLAPGRYGRLEPPAELAGYGNGRIPAAALSPIGVGQHRLWAPAADACRKMVAAAAADGVTIGITDSYRDYDAQVSLARRKGLYSEGGLAARPGTSNHGWGLSVDLDLDARAQSWMRENAWRFGFVEDVPREPWHWTYRPVNGG